MEQVTLSTPPASASMAAAAPIQKVRRQSSWKKTSMLFGGMFMAVGGLFAGLLLGHHMYSDDSAGDGQPAPSGLNKVISVNTVKPQRKTVTRYLDQPGTIEAYAQAEIYAKASGYLKRIQRAWTGRVPGLWLAQQLGSAAQSTSAAGVARLARMAMCSAAVMERAPQIDIGSPVKQGDVLIEVDAPELLQDVLQKESLWRQAAAEMEQSRANITTAEAAVEVGKAQVKQAQADIRRASSERWLAEKELERWKTLAKDKVVAAEIAEEKINQVNAKIAALEGTEAKVEAVKAEQSLLSSKLTAARAELKVREAKVRVALDDWRRAQIMADYDLVRAPFDGVVTKRDVDEGDFVQNSTTGQTRRLMVVAAVDQVKVSLQVPDRDCPWIRVGAAAKVTLEAQNRMLDGRITRSSNALDPQTRTMQVEIDLDNVDRQLRPGDYVQVRIVLQKLDDASVVPVSAVYTRKNSTYLLLADGGVVRRQPARIRYDDGREMVVVKVQGDLEVPVDAADELIVSTKGEIAEGQRVKCTLLNSVPAPKAGGAGKGSKDGPRTQLPTPLHSAEIVDLCGGVEPGWLPSWMAGASAGRDSVAPAGHLHAAARSPRAGEGSGGSASAY